MVGAFARSWTITKLSFKVMREDKELFLFPVLAGAFSLAFLLAMLIPTVVTAFLANGTIGGVLGYAVLFLVYLGLAFIATFFNVCVVYTVKTRFEGKDATFGESLRFAFSKIGLILAWSLLAAIVGLVLRIIDAIAERIGGVGEIVIKVVTSLLGGAWAIVTIFVVPGMVYKGLGPVAAIGSSVQTLKKTWGESLIRAVGLGLVELVAIVLGAILFVALAIAGISLGGIWGLLSVLLVATVYFVGVLTFFSLANAIFNTALYHYAETGKVPMGYDAETLNGAFAKKQ